MDIFGYQFYAIVLKVRFEGPRDVDPCAGSSFPYAQRHAILGVRGRYRKGIDSCRLNAKHLVKIVLDRLNFGVLHTEKSNLMSG